MYIYEDATLTRKQWVWDRSLFNTSLNNLDVNLNFFLMICDKFVLQLFVIANLKLFSHFFWILFKSINCEFSNYHQDLEIFHTINRLKLAKSLMIIINKDFISLRLMWCKICKYNDIEKCRIYFLNVPPLKIIFPN